MTIPVGRRRLVLTLLPARPTAADYPAAAAATDAELVRLAGAAPDLDRARWEALRLMYGPTRR